MNLEELRNAKEKESADARHNTGLVFEMLVLAIQIIYGAAKAGNVQCQQGLTTLELKWKLQKK